MTEKTYTNTQQQKVTSIRKGRVFAWSLWDWGSAAFNAVVTTFVFTVYLTSESFGDEKDTSAALGTALMIAGIAVAILAPVIGRITDSGGNRKKWLAINSAIVTASIALLVFVAPTPNYLILGLTLLAVGNIAFEFGSVSYNAMLSQLAPKTSMGRVSGFGWGMGYIGGIVLLALVLIGFILPDIGWFGVTGENGWNVRIAMLLCAAWFGLFAIPVFFAIPEVAPDPETKIRGLVTGYRELFQTLKTLWKTSKQLLFFLLASAIFRDGLAGVFTFAGVLAAKSFGFENQTVIFFAIAANLVSGLATILGGILEDKLHAKTVIVGSLTCMVAGALLLFALAGSGQWVFWVFGLGIAIFVGPVQSASRSYLAKLIPEGREGEIFGLYATTGRAVSFLAPAAFTFAVLQGGDTIYGILGIGAILLLGLLLMLPIKNAARK